MTDRTNRRDAIIEAASRLFMEHGYAATSIRQIADEVGVTEAALYYHFKDGKRALLQAVLEYNLPDLVRAIDELEHATSLRELVVWFGRTMARTASQHMGDKLRWIIREFPNFTSDERTMIYNKHLEFRGKLFGYVRPFVNTDETAEHLVWTLIFVAFGYGQLMIAMDMQTVVDFDLDQFGAALAEQITCPTPGTK